MVTTTIKYDINEDKETIAENLVETARLANVTLGNGNISVNGDKVDDIIFAGDLDVQISSDTAIVTYIEPNLENFVQAVSMQGGTAQITDGLLYINVSSPDLDGYVNSVSVSGGDADIIGNSLNISIPTARQVINGSSVTAANFVGSGIKSVSYVDNVANVSIETAQAGNISVNGYTAPAVNFSGGGAVVSYNAESNTINIDIETNKANPMLSVASTYLLPNTPTTITINSNSDGIIYSIPNSVISAQQISANQFQISATQLGDFQLGFTQQATQDYYGSSKNALISVVNEIPNFLNLNFENTQNLYENSGSENIHIVTPAEDSDTALTLVATTLEDYKAAHTDLNTANKFLYGNLEIGGKPFTIEFRGSSSAPYGSYYNPGAGYYSFWAGEDLLISSNGGNYTYATTFSIGNIVTDPLDTSYYHFALTYENSTLRFFHNGNLISSVNKTVQRGIWKFSNSEFRGWLPTLAKLQVTDGVCKYQSNFTPLF